MEMAPSILMAGSALFGAFGEISQSQAEARALKAEARAAEIEAGVARRNAETAEADAGQRRVQAEHDKELRMREARRLSGQQRARAGASGALGGSALLLLNETAEDAALDLGVLETDAVRDIDRFLTESRNFMAQADGLMASARSSRSSASSARRGGFVRAGATLLGGAGRAVGSLPPGTF